MPLEPTHDAEQIRKIIRLQMDLETMRRNVEQCQSEHKESIEEVYMALRANVAIAEENQQLRTALASQLGDEWQHDSTDALHKDKLWESVFKDLIQHMKKAVPVPDTSMGGKFHDLFALHNQTEETLGSWNFPTPATGTLALSTSAAQMQVSSASTSGHGDFSQSLFVRGVSSLVEVMEMSVPLSSPTHVHVASTLPSEVTTLMVRNVPARFSTQKLLEVWPPDGTYNFLYVPCASRTGYRSGLAVINMVSHEAATDFTARWHGKKLAANGGSKRLHIVAATIQGFMENLQHFKKSKVPRKEDQLPMLFKGTRMLNSKALLAHMDWGVVGEDQLEFFAGGLQTEP